MTTPFSPEDLKRRRRRSIALALILLGLVALFYVTTIVRIGGALGTRVL
ncbi:hypothetical protein BH10PSE7_BH10PSE7_04330 [soil metagenome]